MQERALPKFGLSHFLQMRALNTRRTLFTKALVVVAQQVDAASGRIKRCAKAGER
ncbi:MAG: hypothetical protein IV107_15935 [Paucibacter sp.]|nr:hypothetical protein [Roseateles sp.]